MDRVEKFKEEISSWASWTKTNFFLSENFFLESINSRDELGLRRSVNSQNPPWLNNLSDALNHASVFRESFCAAAEAILYHNPLDIFVREAIFDYLDEVTRTEEWTGDPYELEAAKDDAGELIGHLMQLTPIDRIADWPTLAWEARQAARFCQWNRAKELLEHAVVCNLGSRSEALLLRAGHSFLSVYLRSIHSCPK